MAADGEGAGPDEHLLTHPLVLAVIKDLKDMFSLPGDFVRGTVFRESGKHTLMKIMVFMRVM